MAVLKLRPILLWWRNENFTVALQGIWRAAIVRCQAALQSVMGLTHPSCCCGVNAFSSRSLSEGEQCLHNGSSGVFCM